MLGSEAVTVMKQRLGRHTSASSDFESWILTELQQAQQRLEMDPKLPGMLISERSYMPITLGEERVPKPTDFLRERSEDDMQVQDTSSTSTPNDYTEISKGHLDQIRKKYPNEETGRPKQYALQGRYFRVRPIPDKSTYRLWMVYYKKDDVIALDEENEWLASYPDLVMAEAGIILATILKNQSALAMFTQLRRDERLRLITNEVAVEEENLDPNPED